MFKEKGFQRNQMFLVLVPRASHMSPVPSFFRDNGQLITDKGAAGRVQRTRDSGGTHRDTFQIYINSKG